MNGWFGCPTRGLFARAEIIFGFNGWTYDPCCNDRGLEESYAVNLCGDPSLCELNVGAKFGIQYPAVIVNEQHNISGIMQVSKKQFPTIAAMTMERI